MSLTDVVEIGSAPHSSFLLRGKLIMVELRLRHNLAQSTEYFFVIKKCILTAFQLLF